jgi:tripartite-type tricarboxylate transporter receptor subunit TctC
MLGRLILTGVLMGGGAVLSAAPALAQADFKGKTITVITSTGAGGTYDIAARAVARFMPRYLPGNPNMVVQNMPGGGNVLATNFLYNVAPKDGTTFASLHNAIPLHQVLDGKGVRYDARKFNWLGSLGPENSVIAVWHTAGVKTFKDLQTKEVILGGTGAGSGIVIFPTIMNNIMGTKFKIVMGYKSSDEVNIAIERGEVQSRSSGLASIFSQNTHWVTEKKMDFPAQIGFKRDKRIPDVPLLQELATTEEQRQILRLMASPTALGKPFVAPPDMPADRVALLRKGFETMLADKAFLDEMAQRKIEVDPMSADEVTQIVLDTVNTPPEAVAKAKLAAGPQEEGR